VIRRLVPRSPLGGGEPHVKLALATSSEAAGLTRQLSVVSRSNQRAPINRHIQKIDTWHANVETRGTEALSLWEEIWPGLR
jgi:hypothetical protein